MAALMIFYLLSLFSACCLGSQYTAQLMSDSSIVITKDGSAYNGNGAVTTIGNVQTFSQYPSIQWYMLPTVNVTTAMLPSEFLSLFDNGTPYNITMISVNMYRADNLDDVPLSMAFGGSDNYYCPPFVHVSVSPISCYSYTNNTVGALLASVSEIDNTTWTVTVTANNDSIADQILTLQIVRLLELSSITSSMNNSMAPENQQRKITSRAPVGFAIFFLIIAMISLLVILAIYLGWLFVVFIFVPSQPSHAYLHTIAWFVLLLALLIIITFTAKFPGWVILGGIYFFFILLFTAVYLVYHCFKFNEDSTEIEMEKVFKGSNDLHLLKSAFAVKPGRFAKLQCRIIISFAIIFVVSLVAIGICYAGWNTTDYYVWDRQHNIPVVEIQPTAVSKSTLAFYTFDGLALTVNLNFFLVLFTDWCADYYTENLTAAEKQSRIYENYVVLYQIDMSTFDPSNWQDYDSVNDFFIRKLANGSRPIASPNDDSVLVSPADSRVLILPNLPSSFSVVIKDEGYDLPTLFGNATVGNMYVGGVMIIIRLAPQDYHRYHAPIGGKVFSRTELTGTIFSVNADALTSDNEVYYNQRSVSLVSTNKFKTLGFISVGATCVGSIVENFDVGSVWTKGDQIGQFEYGGSTVLLFFEPGVLNVDDDLMLYSSLGVETYVHVGTRLGVSNL